MVITTSSVEAVQGELDIVHLRVAVPGTFNPVTSEVGEPGVAMVAVPETTDQTPVPTEGVFPASLAVFESHAGYISVPALAVVGRGLEFTVTEDVLACVEPH